MTKNRIHQLIDRNHVETPRVKNLFGKVGRGFLEGLNLSGIDQRLLRDHLQILDSLHEHIRKTEVWIEKELKGNTLIDILSSLPGFGKVLSHLASLKKSTTSIVSEPRLNLPRTHIFSLYLCKWREGVPR